MDGNHCLLDPQQECFGVKEAARLEKEFHDFQRKHEKIHENVDQRLNALDKAYAVRDEQYRHIIEKLDDLTHTVNTLKEKPAQRWDGVVDKIIFAIVGGIIVYVLARLGFS